MMKKKDMDLIQEKIGVLIGQPLREIYRFAGASTHFGFGEMVETDVFERDESNKLVKGDDGKYVKTKGLRPKFALRNECCMRMTCGDEIVFAKHDIFLPNSALLNQSNFDWDSFDWKVFGGNYFDEMVEKYLGKEPFGFVVKKISVSKFGDLTIKFENEFSLELFADSSGRDENWRFFDMNPHTPHLVVLGDGIEKPDCK